MSWLDIDRAEITLSSELASPKTREFSTSDKLRAEAELLASVPANIGNGIVKSAHDAWEHKWRSGLEIGAGLVLGSAFTLLSRNPNTAVRFTTTWMTRGFIAATAVDLTSRIVKPMSAVWRNPESLELQKVQLGNNLGDAALNYGLGIAGGIAGAKLTERFIAPTRLGGWLQGFKETTISAGELNNMVPKPAGSESGRMTNSFAGGTRSSGGAGLDLPAGKVKLRELPDGSKIGSASDGSVVVLTKDGTAMYFKNQSSILGLKRNLELQRVVHADGTHADLSVSTLQAAGKPNGVIGRDPSFYFDGGGREAGTAESFQIGNGTRISTDARGAIRHLQTESGNVVHSLKGDWQYKPAGGKDTTGLELKFPAYSLKTTTDWLLGYKKGAQLGVVSKFMDTVSELGSGIVQHEIILRLPRPNADRVKRNSQSGD